MIGSGGPLPVAARERGTPASGSGVFPATLHRAAIGRRCHDDGHSEDERRQADLLLAFGKATWPHLLARAMLAEQLYRATTIIAGHPYHRSG